MRARVSPAGALAGRAEVPTAAVAGSEAEEGGGTVRASVRQPQYQDRAAAMTTTPPLFRSLFMLRPSSERDRYLDFVILGMMSSIQAMAASFDPKKSVSYTHLTLPT